MRRLNLFDVFDKFESSLVIGNPRSVGKRTDPQNNLLKIDPANGVPVSCFVMLHERHEPRRAQPNTREIISYQGVSKR